MKPLCILPFDHRGSFARDLLGKAYPVSEADHDKLVMLREVIFEGFLKARAAYHGQAELMILTDDELGETVLARAVEAGIPFALTTESAEHSPFSFTHGERFGEYIERYNPAYAKALFYYQLDDDAENAQGIEELKKLSAYCREHGVGFMLEVLLISKNEIADPVTVMKEMIHRMHREEVQPTLWKLEGLSSTEEWKSVATIAQAPIIILGRGQSRPAVEAWLTTAAKSGVVQGFAVGRTVFIEPLKGLIAGTLTEDEAAQQIANNYTDFIHLWEDVSLIS